MACACKSGSKQTLQLIDRVAHNPTTYSFDFTSLEPLEWREGDSSNLFVQIQQKTMGKKFSYATLPNEHIIRFTTRIRENRSDYKEALSQLNIGDFVEVTEPSGGFTLRRDERPALLLSNGVGIATMRGLIHAYVNNPIGIGRISQINVDHSGFIYKEEFDSLARSHPDIKSIYTKHRNDFWQAVELEVQELLYGTGKMPYFYVVGSDAFILDVEAYIRSRGFDESDMILDRQSGACGCGSNEPKEKVVLKAKDKPLFRISLS